MSAFSVTHTYFEASNGADFDTIARLLMEDATYSSDSLGLLYGRQDILAMMGQLCAHYQCVHWAIDSAKELGPHIAEVHFSFSGKRPDGQPEERNSLS